MTGVRSELHNGRVVRCFHPRPESFYAMFRAAADERPDAEAVVFGDVRLTYADLDDRSARLASGLARLGMGSGDRLAVLIGNRPEFVDLFLAAQKLGAIFVPLSVRDSAAGIAHGVTDCGAKVLVHEADQAGKLDRLPPIQTVGLGPPGEPGHGYLDLLAHGPLDSVATAAEDDCCAILYTSGTTGHSKGVMLTHCGLVHSVMHYQRAMALGSAERSIVAVPFSHVTGLAALLCTMLGLGGTLLIMAAFSAGDFLDLAERERATHTVMVPAMYKLCQLHPRMTDADLSAWRIGAYGGAVMAAETIAGLAERLPNLVLMNCYGATETTSPAVIMPLGEGLARREYIGRSVECGEILIMDDDGREVLAGETGELWIAGPMVTPGYWRNAEATARELIGGYWKSGDLGLKDAGGFIRILDRRKDVINRGGFKIFSAEVEAALLSHPNVTEAAVVPKPCPVLGERVHAFIFANAEVAPEALRAHCGPMLADYAAPESFTFASEPLPRNANGKILKRELRQQLL